MVAMATARCVGNGVITMSLNSTYRRVVLLVCQNCACSAGAVGSFSNTTLPQVVLVDIVFTPFPTQRAVAMATIGSATARLVDIGSFAMT